MISLLLLATVARAEIPEPDNVIYGAITLGATPVTAVQTNVVIEARKTANGPVVSYYRMGQNPTCGDAYSLEIPLEAFVPLANTNASRVGALLYLSVRDNAGVRDTRTVSISQRGQLVRLDFIELDTDGDGLPDRWESQYFGSATGANPLADPDGDGRKNLQEFLDGTNPLLADGRHPADNSPSDNFISFEEADAYANAWLTGDVWPANPTNIPVAYVARAASLALNGTPYLFTNAPPTNAPMWWVSTPYAGPGVPRLNIATGRPLPVNPSAGSRITVSLQIVPTNNVLAYAVEDHPPTGWTEVQNISHGGSYDPLNRAVKWGPFFDNGVRELSYELVRPVVAAATNTFAGLASFDGFDVAISGGRTIVLPAANGTPPTWISSSIGNNGASLAFRLHGAPASRYAIESTTNFITWSVLQTNITDANGNYVLQVTNSPPVVRRFYRARLVD